MAGRLSWDNTGERLYETGVDRGVLYPFSNSAYQAGVVWNGLSVVNENPSGAEESPIYADNIKYLSLYSVEEFGMTIEAYMYPDEFRACQGSTELLPGVTIQQQDREKFGFSYRTLVGNDAEGTKLGYKIHLVYGCMAGVSEEENATVNDSPEAKTFSWEVTTTPVTVTGADKPTATMVIDSTKVTAAQLTAIEDILYGTDTEDARLPLPDEVVSILKAAV